MSFEFTFTLEFTPGGHVSRGTKQDSKAPTPKQDSKARSTPPAPPKAKPARAPSPVPPPLDPSSAHLWHAVSRTSYISVHICPCCQRRTEFFAGHTVLFRARDIVAKYVTNKTHALAIQPDDSSYAHLPRILEYLTPQRVECVACTVDVLLVDSILAGKGPAQFPLFPAQ